MKKERDYDEEEKTESGLSGNGMRAVVLQLRGQGRHDSDRRLRGPGAGKSFRRGVCSRDRDAGGDGKAGGLYPGLCVRGCVEPRGGGDSTGQPGGGRPCGRGGLRSGCRKRGRESGGLGATGRSCTSPRRRKPRGRGSRRPARTAPRAW